MNERNGRTRRQVLGPSLSDITDAYKCSRTAVFEVRSAGHAGFRTFCTSLGRFLGTIRGTGDEYWLPLIRHLQRFKFDISATPVRFAVIGRASAERHSAVATQYAGCERLYPVVASQVRELLDRVQELSILNDAPLLDCLRKCVDEAPGSDGTAVVIAEPRLVSLVEREFRSVPTLRLLEILTPPQLRSPHCYSRLFLIGPGRGYPDHVVAAPRATRVTSVHFGWMTGSRRAARLLPRQHGRDVSEATDASNLADSPVRSEIDEATASATSESTADVDWLWYAGSGLSDLARAAGADQDAERHELIRALPVALEGDGAVFLDAEDGASAMVIDLEERGKRRVRRVATLEIEEGMFVLLRAGGGGDLVVPVADSLLKERAAECRRLQLDWKRRLRERIRASNLLEVSVALLDHGALRANESNLRRWVWERSIRPDSQNDFSAILRLVGLANQIDKYVAAMRLIERAHAKAGQAIRRVLLERVHCSDLGELERLGVMEFDIPGAHSGRMIAARVKRVGKETVPVNASQVGRPFDRGGM